MTAAGASSRDVIVALATAPGDGPMAVVRASGDGAAEALRHMDARMPEGPMRRCVRSAELRLSAGSLPCLVACMPGPHSYTGEDSFELFVPGHAEVVRLVLQASMQSPGVREAGPGEFTLRAFEQGRLTLEQAEGVAATIAARTDAEVQAAAMLRSGTVGTRVHQVSETVADLLALVEAGIDFTDQEDVVAIGRAELCAGIEASLASLRQMIDGSVPLERLAATPWVLLAGAPNAGKSALFNALLGRRRAVVAAVAGTTRDVLVEPWRVPATTGTLEVLLVDAPGEMRDAHGLDALGQHMRDQAMQRATITITCDADGRFGEAIDPSPRIRVRTKCDGSEAAAPGTIATSAMRGTGLDALAATVGRMAEGLGATTAAAGAVLAERHRTLIGEAIDHLQAALGAAQAGKGRVMEHPELVSAALHGAIESLGGIAGRLAPDDILGRIFSRFCVGK